MVTNENQNSVQLFTERILFFSGAASSDLRYGFLLLHNPLYCVVNRY